MEKFNVYKDNLDTFKLLLSNFSDSLGEIDPFRVVSQFQNKNRTLDEEYIFERCNIVVLLHCIVESVEVDDFEGFDMLENSLYESLQKLNKNKT